MKTIWFRLGFDNSTAVKQNAVVSTVQGLPVQVRDGALGLKDEIPKSDVNKEYYTQNAEKEVTK